jgi:nitrite reductase/ring-hydroxylating ferredoxin subunit
MLNSDANDGSFVADGWYLGNNQLSVFKHDAHFVRLAAESELPSVGEAREFSCGNKPICVANVDGVITAIDNICLHRGGPLGQGVIEQGKIVCPWHGWQWDPATGEAAHNARARVAVYPLKVENGEVFIEV